MKKYIVGLVLAVLWWAPGQLGAQKPGPGGCKGFNADCLLQCLDLNDEQQENIATIREEFIEKCSQLHADTNLTPQERREQMKALMESRHDKLSKVLTEDQLQKFGKCCMGKGIGRGGPGVPAGPVHGLLLQKRKEFEEVLSKQEKEIIATAREEMRTHRDEMARTRPADRPGRRGMLEENRSRMEEKMKVLDPVIDNHREELDAIRDEVARVIGEKRENRRDGKRFNREPGEPGKEDRDVNKRLLDRRFLLMDPDRPDMSLMNEGADEMGLVVYPNPAKDMISIEFDLAEGGEVTIDLLDNTGALIKQLDRSDRRAGHHSFSLDVSDLHSGDLHYIRVSTAGKSVIGKFVRI